ncbi:MAG: prephenate dehydrogenase [Clostridia bacterium]|nr:prephenate dehydrogenase [Clostridia bacterium]
MKSFTKDTKILIIGLGVMGGSYARALSGRGYRVRCITKEQKDIDYAKNLGIIEEGSTCVTEETVAWADLVVFALYPHVFIEWIQEHQSLFRPNTLITDVTGVKSQIVDRVQALLRQDVEFIAAHPMAGRESSGVEYSDDSVFEGANFIVTPTPKNTPDAIEAAKELGRVLGFARISQLTPEEHDEMIAFLSQLTHCIAVTLMTCNETPMMENYTGDSFRDLTRIAKINDVMWAELFLLNREALLAQMDAFSAEFDRFRRLLEEGDGEGMRQVMRKATARRTLFDKQKKKK